MLPKTLFPAWRPVWERHPAFTELAAAGDRLLLRRRQQGPEALPGWTLDDDGRAELALARDVYDRLREPTQQDANAFLSAHGAALAVVRPLMETTRWSRWLLQEESLANASSANDLVSGAQVLRTQIEELAVHLRVAELERRLPHGVLQGERVEGTVEDCERILKLAEICWRRILPIGSGSV